MCAWSTKVALSQTTGASPACSSVVDRLLYVGNCRLIFKEADTHSEPNQITFERRLWPITGPLQRSPEPPASGTLMLETAHINHNKAVTEFAII